MISILDKVRLREPVLGDSPIYGRRELPIGTEAFVINNPEPEVYEIELMDPNTGIPLSFALVHESLLTRLNT